jgi:asparagine synthase (glutamine-hydrolysing)
MCGIAGSTKAETDVLAAMAGRLAHRGPDASGLWTDPQTGLGLVHTRLAIIDLSPGGAQPMHSPCGRWVIAFNGEIYNYQELRHQLEQVGETFSSHSDTEVLLRLLMREGLECLPRLAGMFAFALWDRKTETLTLVRDRLGVKPLVYAGLPDGGLAFASEIHALRIHSGIDLSWDRDALSHYLACLYVPAPMTLHQGIKKLPPGSWLVWKNGTVTNGRWWEPRFGGDESLSEEQAVEAVLPLLDQAVKRRLVADVEVGCFLSGGIDSSVIAALMAKDRKANGLPPPRTFTMTFDEAAYDERHEAKLIADHLGTRHQELPARSNLVDYLPQMVTAFGEPFGNPTALLIHELSGQTRQHVTVALAGDGGDEVFGGYPRYKGGIWAEQISRKVPKPVRWMVAQLAGLIPESQSGRHSWRRAREFLSSLALSQPDRYAHWVEYFGPDQRKALLKLAALPSSPIADQYRAQGLKDPLDAMQQTDLVSFLPGNLLSYGDAMSMSVALEVRLPLIDHQVVERVGAISAQTRFARGPKTILKAVARRLIPPAIVDRPKLGFNPPMGVWLKQDLKALVDQRITQTAMESLGLDWSIVASLIAEQKQGYRDHALKIWALLVLENWANTQSPLRG